MTSFICKYIFDPYPFRKLNLGSYFFICRRGKGEEGGALLVRIYGSFFALHKYKRGKVVIYLRPKSVKSLQMRLWAAQKP